MPTYDDRLAQLALKEGKVTLAQLTDARDLVAKMAQLGVKRDLLGALVDRGVLTSEEADRLRAEAAAADPDGPVGAPAEAPSAHVASPPALEAEAIEEAETVEEAELVAETTTPAAAGASPPAGPPSAMAAGSAEEAQALPEAPIPGAKQVASVGSWQAPCHRHPGRAAVRKCKACGKPLCPECIVQTPDGIFCGEACFLGFSPFGGGESGGAVAGPERSRRRVWPLVALVALVPAVIVITVCLRPSEALKKARRLKARVLELEEKRRAEEALEAARELASMPPEGGRVKDIISWGRTRSKLLKRKTGLAAVGRIRQSLAALATGDQNALSRKRRELDALASRFSDVGEVTRAIDRLRGDVDERLAAARSSPKAPKRGGATAVRAARPVAAKGPVKRPPSLAKLSVEVEDLLKARRFAEAGAAVEKVRRAMGARVTRGVLTQLSQLDGKTLSAARKAYLAEDHRAQALASKGSFAEARGIYRRLIGEIGIDEITIRARKALESLDRTQRTALQRSDLQRAAEAVAKARRLIDSFDYALAQAVLERARRGLQTEAARTDVDLWLDVARREHAVLREIVQMISAKPLDLEALQSGGPKGTKGVIFKADETGYSVRIKFKVGGSTVSTSPWNRLPADQMCRLAKLAAGKQKETLVGLALFCGARGGRSEAAWAIGLLRRSGDREAEGLEERYAARLSPPSGTEEPGDGPRDAGKVAKAPTGPPSGGAKTVKPKEQEKERGKEAAPRYIEVTCGICRGSGALKRLGCSKCKGVGYIGVDSCGSCGGTGKSDYPCPYCRGNSVVVVDGRSHRCGGCGGRGYPACLACGGKGKIKRADPKAAGGPTVPCRLCNSSGLDSRLYRCRRCGGRGAREVSDGNWIRRITCAFCGGMGKARPKCRVCDGKGYSRRAAAFPSGETRVPCRACFGTGDVVGRCRACGGRGWIKTE
jgi:tetratricopeptide (TPR) repeat protein